MGDIIVFPHADPYAMSNDAMTADNGSDALVQGEASLQFFRDMAAGRLPFVVSEGGGGTERARFICGFLGCDTRPFNPLFKALPRLLRIRRSTGKPPDLLDKLIDLTLIEAGQQRAGGNCIRLGLCELIFVEVLRRYLAAQEESGQGWLSGLRDPAIARALALLHADPAHGWTVEELARRTGMSRSVLAERFTRLVGYAPMQYLTEWRMQIAAGLLAESDDKVAVIGRDVGYDSEAAFSRTFKRIAGQSPAIWRQRMGR
jgi:AraC-like DNA-binding protein